jgi:O-antigen/teichoic acid export membrane protein
LAAGGLFFLGPPLVKLLYDSRYTTAGWMLSVLGLTLVATRLDVFDQCLVALGRVRLLSVLNAVRLVALYTLVPAGYLGFGIEGAVAAVAISAFFNSVVVLCLQARLGLIDLRKEALALPIFAAGLLAGWLLRTLLR